MIDVILGAGWLFLGGLWVRDGLRGAVDRALSSTIGALCLVAGFGFLI